MAIIFLNLVKSIMSCSISPFRARHGVVAIGLTLERAISTAKFSCPVQLWAKPLILLGFNPAALKQEWHGPASVLSVAISISQGKMLQFCGGGGTQGYRNMGQSGNMRFFYKWESEILDLAYTAGWKDRWMDRREVLLCKSCLNSSPVQDRVSSAYCIYIML